MKAIQKYFMLVLGLLVVVTSCETEPIKAIDSENLTLDVTHATRASGPSANGQGTLTLPGVDGDITRHFSFHARTMNNGSTKGNGQITYTAGELKLKFDIDCMDIAGNTAIFSGTITRFNEDSTLEGTGFWFKVEDNGEGANDAPDQMTLFQPGLVGLDCTVDLGLALSPIEGGNIQVKS